MKTDAFERWRTILRTPAGKLACWFGVFTLLALVDAAQLYAGQQFEEFKISRTLALRRAFEASYPLAVLGLGVLWLVRRWPLERDHAMRWFAFHFGMALVFAALYSLAYAGVLNGQMSVKGKPFEFTQTFKKLMVFYTHAHVACYWIILLVHDGWLYYQRFRERERRAAELEGQLARAQLQALRMQLNPHFLFNTLNTVAALIHEQPELADRTITRLSELLRQNLDCSNTLEVPLRQELRFLERYLEIEQIRFGDRLAVEIVAPPELAEVLVPTLILQPIVENAICHGIEEREAAGRVRIEAARHDGWLELTVRDNGPGLAPQAAAREGIGLANTRSRLQHLYGACQKLELREANGGGCEVRIQLPCRTPADPIPACSCASVLVGCNRATAQA